MKNAKTIIPHVLTCSAIELTSMCSFYLSLIDDLQQADSDNESSNFADDLSELYSKIEKRYKEQDYRDHHRYALKSFFKHVLRIASLLEFNTEDYQFTQAPECTELVYTIPTSDPQVITQLITEIENITGMNPTSTKTIKNDETNEN